MTVAAKPAASVCLLHRPSASIMMGRRLVGPWPGYWAFPGGGVDSGETRLQAALRELAEETSILIPDAEPLLITEVDVSFGPDRRYAITNFVIEVATRFPGATSDELEPMWIEIGRVDELEPIARGTRTVLDRVIKLFGG